MNLWSFICCANSGQDLEYNIIIIRIYTIVIYLSTSIDDFFIILLPFMFRTFMLYYSAYFYIIIIIDFIEKYKYDVYIRIRTIIVHMKYSMYRYMIIHLQAEIMTIQLPPFCLKIIDLDFEFLGIFIGSTMFNYLYFLFPNYLVMY